MDPLSGARVSLQCPPGGGGGGVFDRSQPPTWSAADVTRTETFGVANAKHTHTHTYTHVYSAFVALANLRYINALNNNNNNMSVCL